MAWWINGRFFECCNCEVPCPCTVAPWLGADYDRCLTFTGYRVESGVVEGVDVGNLNVVTFGDLPKFLLEDGGRRTGIIIDDAASDVQAAKLTAVFSGQLGGSPAATAGMRGEFLGAERAVIRFSSERRGHRFVIEGRGQFALRDLVPSGEADGAPARLLGSFHPATVNARSDGEIIFGTPAEDTDLEAFGIRWVVNSGFSGRFSWAN
jgi:hypothetical protein